MKQKTKDNLIYLGVGLTIAGGFATHIFYTVRTTGRVPEMPTSILWGIFSTPITVALIFNRFWQFRRRRTLWVVAIVAASINVLAMFGAYSFRWDPPAIVWILIMLPWMSCVLIVAEKFVGRNRRGRSG